MSMHESNSHLGESSRSVSGRVPNETLAATSAPASTDVKTKILVVSNTYNNEWVRENTRLPQLGIDVAIHCGDFTNNSSLDELKKARELLDRTGASLKLIVPGDHEHTLDLKKFKSNPCETTQHQKDQDDPLDRGAREECLQLHGPPCEAKKLFQKDYNKTANGIVTWGETNIHLLESPGTNDFVLANGAKLRVYVNPCTSSSDAAHPGFRFDADRPCEYNIGEDVDVVITHGAPLSVLDESSVGERRGCEKLSEAIAKARPLLHCFGHVSEAYGAAMIKWNNRGDALDRDVLEHMRDGQTHLIGVADESGRGEFQRLTTGNNGTPPMTVGSLRPGETTLFVNAALGEPNVNGEYKPLPWLVEIDLPLASTSSYAKEEKYKAYFSCDRQQISGRLQVD